MLGGVRCGLVWGVHPHFTPKGFEVMLWIHLATSAMQRKILIAADLLSLILIGDILILSQSPSALQAIHFFQVYL